MHLQGVPIVVISAVQDALKRLDDLPIHASIAKPFDLDELIRTVSTYARPTKNGSS